MSIASKTQNREAETRGPGRPKDVQKDAAIIAAAQRLFMERGFDGASMDAIAEAADVSKATVYARFSDKEALLREAIANKCGSYLDAETTEWRPGRDLRQSLIGFSRRFLDLVTDPEALAMLRLIMGEGQRGPQLPTLFFESAILPTVEKLSLFFAAEAPRSGLKIDDPTAAAWRFLGMIKGEDHMRAMLGVPTRSKAEIDRHIAACVEMFIAAHRTQS